MFIFGGIKAVKAAIQKLSIKDLEGFLTEEQKAELRAIAEKMIQAAVQAAVTSAIAQAQKK